MNDYYVYEWIRLDTNEPFYVGKGKGNRCYKLTRGNNQHFNNIVKSIPVAVNILHDSLDEETAFGLECYYIWLYRDIIGYDMTNMNDGGEGQTLCGENNYWYGKGYLLKGDKNPNYGNGDKIKGEKNPMYGKNAFEGKTEEEMKDIIEKRLITLKNRNEEDKEKTRKRKSESMSGENNPMYGKHHTEETKEKIRKKSIGRKYSEETKQLWSEQRKGKKHPMAKAVICVTTGKIFYTAKEGADYYNIKNSSEIGRCCKGKHKSCGKLSNGIKLSWKYLKDFLEECKYQLL